MAHQPGTTIQAFGQTWHFSPEAIAALGLIGVGARSTLKTLIINITPWDGLPEGVHAITHHRIGLEVTVQGGEVTVDALDISRS